MTKKSQPRTLAYPARSLPAQLRRTIAYAPYALPLLCLAAPVQAEESANALPAITINAQSPLPLQNQVSVGSNLDLTPLQTPASVSVINRQQLEERGDASITDAAAARSTNTAAA
ncbi:MAG: hypothetical protein J0I13_15170 [Rhizobiales bacterium]|nr:hypothetical protein [Hyphomicrobiales bacterium]